MDQLVDMGFPHDLAAQALAATGGKSTLTATEWILGQIEARNSSMSKHPHPHPHPQLQGRVDQFFASSSGRRVPQHQPGTGSSSHFGHPAEDDSNVHWRTRPSSSVSPSPGVDRGPEFVERKRFSSGKAQDEDLSLSMFRKGSQAPGTNNNNQGGGREYSGFTPPSTSKPRPSDINNETVASTTGKSSAAAPHPRPPMLEPSNKRPKPNDATEQQQHQQQQQQQQQQEEGKTTPVPVWKQAAPAAPMFGAKVASKKNLAPLAERMRPAAVDLVVGQDHLLGPRCILRSLIDNNSLSSIIFWGPPGTGKTSLVRAIARAVSYRFFALSAVSSGLKEVREILEEAKRARKFGERTLLFLDEIHRFNKAQQDAFLPFVEAGHIVFIGATTENPSFEINAALLSRCKVLTLNKLQPEHIRSLLERAILDKEKGLLLSFVGSAPGDVVKVEEDALQFLASAADGDARAALNSLEIAGLAAFAASETTNTTTTTTINTNKITNNINTNTNNTNTNNINTNTNTNTNISTSTPPRRINLEEKHFNMRSEVVVNVKADGDKDVYTSSEVVKQETSSSVMVVSTSATLKRDLSGNGFGIKRLEVLKENLKKENSLDDYTKPFKRFVGGKEVVKGMREVKERSLSGETQGDSGGYLVDVGSKDMRERDGSSERMERPAAGNNNLYETGGDVAGGVDTKKERRIVITLQQVQEAIQRSHVLYDKTGEEHYNIISALHKSMRGGDPDAAIYWLARMLEGGEGPLYVARRLIRFASEDVGLADPQALVLAVACYQACHFIGMPECNVNLAQCVTYLARAPKSVVVYHAIEAAQRLVKGTKQNEPVPMHLRNAPTQLMKDLGYGRQPEQPPPDFMPPSLRGQKFLINPR